MGARVGAKLAGLERIGRRWVGRHGHRIGAPLSQGCRHEHTHKEKIKSSTNKGPRNAKGLAVACCVCLWCKQLLDRRALVGPCGKRLLLRRE